MSWIPCIWLCNINYCPTTYLCKITFSLWLYEFNVLHLFCLSFLKLLTDTLCHLYFTCLMFWNCICYYFILSNLTALWLIINVSSSVLLLLKQLRYSAVAPAIWIFLVKWFFKLSNMSSSENNYKLVENMKPSGFFSIGLS